MLALSPAKWTYDSLYVILDVFSRYVVGWTVQHRESAALAEQLITQATLQQQIRPGQPTVHADRGSSMTSKTGRLPAGGPGHHQDPRAFCRAFFHWYNHEQRTRVLAAAHAATPERFVNGAPRPPELPAAAWINRS